MKARKHTAFPNSSPPGFCGCSAQVAALDQLWVFSRSETIQEMGFSTPVLPPSLSFTKETSNFKVLSEKLPALSGQLLLFRSTRKAIYQVDS